MQERRLYKCIMVAWILCIVAGGVFYDFSGAFMSVFLSILLGICVIRRKQLFWEWSVSGILSVVTLMGYVLASVFAIDRGMAFLGVFKYLWVFLFAVLTMQLKPKEREQLLYSAIPVGVVLALLGLISWFVPAGNELVYVNDRLGGPFQYPNTFAAFLLICLVLLFHRSDFGKKEYIFLGVMLCGIGMSGSRTVFVLTAIVVLGLCIRKRNVKLWILVGILLLITICYVVFSGDVDNIGRITTFSLTESTLIGRVLYTYDALPLLLEHPFGMGYMGYYYIQNQIQSGVYAVKYVHNDWLQIGLDIGIIPMLLWIGLMIKAFCSKTLSSTKKWVVAVIFFHGFLDFNMSYTAMLMLLLLVIMDEPFIKERGRNVARKTRFTNKYVVVVLCGLICLVSSYVFVPTIAYYCEEYEFTTKCYPWHTEAKLVLLSKEDDVDKVEDLADEILEQNDTCALAYYAKAMVAYCKDDYEGVIRHQKESIERNYFDFDEYMNYAYMLYDGMRCADSEIARKCQEELRKIPSYLRAAKEKMSELGKMIDDQPELELNEELELILEESEYY